VEFLENVTRKKGSIFNKLRSFAHLHMYVKCFKIAGEHVIFSEWVLGTFGVNYVGNSIFLVCN